MNIYNEIVRLLSEDTSFVTVTIFNLSGSAPRGAGAKMIVKADGSITGTIGGGKLEAEAIRMTADVFRTKTPVAQIFNLSGSDAAEMDMICGGSGEFMIDYIDASDPVNLEIYSEILNVQNSRGKAWLITSVGTGEQNKGVRQQCLVKQDHTITGKFETDRAFLTKLIQGPARISIHSDVFDDLKLLVEPVRNRSTLYLFGAGHVAQKIASVADTVSFRTVVIDDRAEYANSFRFPSSELIVLKSFDDPLPDLPYDVDSYLAIVTRGHIYDRTVLAQLLTKQVAYIGMIGSIAKREILYKSLAKEYGYDDEDFARVYAPIGLDIKAESPEEIAISVVAELIQVRAEKEKCEAGKKS